MDFGLLLLLLRRNAERTKWMRRRFHGERRAFLQKLISLRTSMMDTSCGVVTISAPSTSQSFRNWTACRFLQQDCL